MTISLTASPSLSPEIEPMRHQIDLVIGKVRLASLDHKKAPLIECEEGDAELYHQGRKIATASLTIEGNACHIQILKMR